MTLRWLGIIFTWEMAPLDLQLLMSLIQQIQAHPHTSILIRLEAWVKLQLLIRNMQ